MFITKFITSNLSYFLNSVQHFSWQSQLAVLLTAGAIWREFGGRIIFRGGKCIFFFPSFYYDIIQHICFPLNSIIGIVCHVLPTRSSIWSEPHTLSKKLFGTGADLEAVKRSLIHGSDRSYHEEDLVKVYDSCKPIAAEELIGNTWNGRIIRTNRSLLDLAEWCLVRPLGLFGFRWGKRYCTQHTGDPLLLRWIDRLYFPLPVWGNVGMVDIRWRGVVTATMNYDYQPWKDYFRVLQEDNEKTILIGVWTHRSVAGGWFTLTLDKSVSTSF
jgi:hypothetical protein